MSERENSGLAQAKQNKNDEFYTQFNDIQHNNADNRREIIDGHQRLVSLTLLFRAIYTQLESVPVSNLINKNKTYSTY